MDRRLIIIGVAVAALAAAVVIATAGSGSDSSNTLTKPTIDAPSGPPPKKLQIIDQKVGDGAVAQQGSQLSVQYVLALYSDGQVFDSSWDSGQPSNFQLGTGSVIPGWDQGLAGMKVGGRRELIVPPNLAYGAKGSPPAIPPNATLIFVIDLLSVS